MREDSDREPSAGDPTGRRAPTRPRPSLWAAALVSVVVSGLVAVGLNLVLVPAGVGWRKLEYEGTVTVHGVDQPQKILYPSPFSKPPNLFIEPTQSGNWFYQVGEQTETHFVIVNTTVNAGTGVPKHLSIRWKASGSRW